MTSATVSVRTEVAGKRSDAGLLAALRGRTARHFMVVSLLLVATGIAMHARLTLVLFAVPTASMLLIGTTLWSAILVLAWRGLSWHPHENFGPANIVTLFRAAGTVLVASLIPVAMLMPVQWLWMLTVLAVLLLSLDGVDGYLARHTRLASSFGARFDMEIDALLILTISVFLWRSGEMGIWITALGLMRYAFLLAGVWLRPLQGDLFTSFRRKLVCVIQLVALCAILSPLISAPLSSVLGAIALICLTGSFTRDILWLYRQRAREVDITAHKAPGMVATIDTSP